MEDSLDVVQASAGSVAVGVDALAHSQVVLMLIPVQKTNVSCLSPHSVIKPSQENYRQPKG